MGLIWFLIVFALVTAGACLAVPMERLRNVVACVGAGVIAVASIVLAVPHLMGDSAYYSFSSEALSTVFFVVDIGLAAYVAWRSVRGRRYAILAMACLQVVLAAILEFGAAAGVAVTHAVYIDSLSAIMVLIIGIIGSGICVYAVGYMNDFQRHESERAAAGEDVPADRRRFFFAVLFVFLAAMFMIVLFNDMAWMLCGWEITTVCSFYLIGYTKTPEAIDNSFRQIWMNLVGGIAFSIALIFIGYQTGVMELDRFVSLGLLAPTACMLPLALLAVAAITKAAQMPFHTWLLGAMVAPTPTSALLHSSTMVKAGVFLLIRLSPLMGTFVGHTTRMGLNPVGISVMLVGATTFLLASLMAVSQSNAKRVLAYSTIANLGLIVACAGIGSGAAVWAAIFLLVFHACAKSLLFLCVGTAEHHIGSRDIESMDSLITRMPRLAALMVLGVCGMFIAPFGVLVSKWAALGAFVNSGVLVIVMLLVFGSAATFFFWAKWLVKLVTSRPGAANVEGGVHKTEWVALCVMAGLLVVCSVFLPLISDQVVSPYVSSLMGAALANPTAADLVLMAICALFIVLVPVLYGVRAHSLSRGLSQGDGHEPNFGGLGVSHDSYRGSLGNIVTFEQRSWYLEGVLSEKSLSLVGTIACGIIVGMGVTCGLGVTLLFLGSVI